MKNGSREQAILSNETSKRKWSQCKTRTFSIHKYHLKISIFFIGKKNPQRINVDKDVKWLSPSQIVCPWALLRRVTSIHSFKNIATRKGNWNLTNTWAQDRISPVKTPQTSHSRRTKWSVYVALPMKEQGYILQKSLKCPTLTAQECLLRQDWPFKKLK